MSEAAERILGRPADSFVGMSFLQIVVPEDREARLSDFQKIIETGSEPTLSFRVVGRDGLRIERALRRIAGGAANEGSASFRKSIAMVAEALGFGRLMVAMLAPGSFVSLGTRIIPWQDGEFVELTGMPEAAVARGETCLHPTGLTRILSAVAERIGRDFDAFAGLPLRLADRPIVGVLGGYSRTPIHDVDLTRSLLSTCATHAAAASEFSDTSPRR